MKFTRSTPNENYPICRFVTEKGLWEAGLYQLAHGNIRVRAGTAGGSFLAIDYSGTIFGDVEQAHGLFRQVVAILESYPEETSGIEIDQRAPVFGVKPVQSDPAFKQSFDQWREERGINHHARADFSYTVEDGVVCITDHDNGPSVTNDAENVILNLAAQGLDLDKLRVIYRDTQGNWDEIVVRDGAFHEFHHLDATDKETAKANLTSTSITP